MHPFVLKVDIYLLDLNIGREMERVSKGTETNIRTSAEPFANKSTTPHGTPGNHNQL